jgi:hypothetical protein
VADLPPPQLAQALRSVNGEEVSRFKLAELITQAKIEDRRAKARKASPTLRPGRT